MAGNHDEKLTRRAFGIKAGTYAGGLLAALIGVGCGKSTHTPWERQDAGPVTPDDTQEFPIQDAGTEEVYDTDSNPIEMTIDDRLLTSAREGGMLGFNNTNGQAYQQWLPVYHSAGNITIANVRINDLTGDNATSISTFDLAQRYVAGGETGAASSDIMLREGLINIFADHLDDMIGSSESAQDHAGYLLDKLAASYNSGNDQGLTLDENGTVNYVLLESGAEGISGEFSGTIGALFLPVKIDGNKRMLAVYGGANSVLGMDHEQTQLFDNSTLTEYVQDMIDDANVGF